MALLTKMLGVDGLDMEQIGKDFTAFVRDGMVLLQTIDRRLSEIEERQARIMSLLSEQRKMEDGTNGNRNDGNA